MHIEKPNFHKYFSLTYILGLVTLFGDLSHLFLPSGQEIPEYAQVLSFLGAIGSGFYGYKGYSEERKKFIQNIKTYGQKIQLTEYEVKKHNTNNSTTYTLHGEVHANGKKRKIRQTISAGAAQIMQSNPPLDLYYDPLNVNKFIYFVDMPTDKQVIVKTLDVFKEKNMGWKDVFKMIQSGRVIK